VTGGRRASSDSDQIRNRPWDEELQPERTALAWNRTVMSLLVAGIVLALDSGGVSRHRRSAAGRHPAPFLTAVVVLTGAIEARIPC
jgi:uncharacterized membrane protein YidH (DUF202 family)